MRRAVDALIGDRGIPFVQLRLEVQDIEEASCCNSPTVFSSGRIFCTSTAASTDMRHLFTSKRGEHNLMTIGRHYWMTADRVA